MKRKIWALVTGAVRSDLYLRTVIVKLCDLRYKGQIEGIVLSTWTGELDIFPGLRDELKQCGVVIVETPYIDEAIEKKFNQLIYARQNTSIYRGLSVIPDDCFVLKLRTDFLVGVRSFLNYIFSSECAESVSKFGLFPIIYQHKVSLSSYNSSQIMFCNDRFFYGYKQDLEKIFTPLQMSKFAKHGRFAENDLLLTYAYQSLPLLHEVWNILNVNFFNTLISYCMKKNDDNLDLPIIIYRVYALIMVFCYTHVSFSCDMGKKYESYEQIPLICLFQNKIRNGYEIEKIVMGKLYPSNASKIFKDELRKIALNLPEVYTYTYEEYKELRDFAENELLDSKLVDIYPYIEKSFNNISSEEAINILFNKYDDSRMTQSFLSNIDLFDSVLSLVNEKNINYKSEMGFSILKAAIFDQTSGSNYHKRVLYEYTNIIKNDIGIFDEYTLLQTKRNLCFGFNENKLNGYAIASMYNFLLVSRKLSKHNNIMPVYYDMLRLFQERRYGKITGFKFEYDLMQSDALLNQMILFLHNSADTAEMTENQIEIIKALLLIAPEKCPFSKKVLEKINKNNLTEIISEIKSLYGDEECNIDDYILSDVVLRAKNKLKCEPFDEIKFLQNLGGVDEIRSLGIKNSECVLKILLSNNVSDSELINILFDNANMNDSILHKAYYSNNSKTFDESDDTCISNSDYLVLCLILKKKGLLKNLSHQLENIASTMIQKAILAVFLRLSDDSNIQFFSMKNNLEMWFNYVPFCESQWNKLLVIPRNENGQIWPWGEFANSSSYAAYLKIADSTVFISIEFCSEPGPVKNNLFANAKLTNVENFDVNSKIIRLKVTKFPFENDEEIGKAVNLALDEFSRIGNILLNVNLELEE